MIFKKQIKTKVRAYLICQNLTESGLGFDSIRHLIWESETGFAKLSKPAWETVSLTNLQTCMMHLFCDKHFMWITLIHVYETVGNSCLTYIALFLSTLYHHTDGFVHSIISAKP